MHVHAESLATSALDLEPHCSQALNFVVLQVTHVQLTVIILIEINQDSKSYKSTVL